MDLVDEKEALEDEIVFWINSMSNPRNTARMLGKLCEKATETYRTLAICRLLCEADCDGFYHDLFRSAKTMEYYLHRCRLEGHVDFFSVSSRNDAFFDAIAANAFDVARSITLLSTDVWFQDDEYEDDFYYTQFFHQWTSVGTVSNGESERILERFEKALEGIASPRYTICNAFFMRNEQSFHEAFDQLIEERTKILALNKEHSMMEDSHTVNNFIFIEGLAILRLAGQVGFKTETEYSFCPSLARVSMKTPFPNDGYPTGDKA